MTHWGHSPGSRWTPIVLLGLVGMILLVTGLLLALNIMSLRWLVTMLTVPHADLVVTVREGLTKSQAQGAEWGTAGLGLLLILLMGGVGRWVWRQAQRRSR